jgi:hypothetical protein
MTVLSQSPSILDLSFNSGDDLSFTITFPFDVSGYTIDCKIGDTAFTVVRTSNYILTLSLTAVQTALIGSGTTWYLKLTKNDYTRTYISGKKI